MINNRQLKKSRTIYCNDDEKNNLQHEQSVNNSNLIPRRIDITTHQTILPTTTPTFNHHQ